MPRLFKSMQDNLANRDGSDHRRLRNLVQVAFTPKRVRQIEDVAQATVERLLDEAERRGELELIADFALPLLIISEMMGVLEADRSDFQRWTSALASSLAKGITGVLWAIRRFPKMRLAVPPEQLQWMLSLTLRGLVALPLRLN